MSLSVRAALAGLTALAGLGLSAGLTAVLGHGVPVGIGLVLACALGLSAVFDGLAAVNIERSAFSVGWLVLTLAAGGLAAAVGLVVATSLVLEASL